MDLLIVTCLSALAGFVDAVVGGGGLILVPALFATYPGVAPATLLGTNKSASVWGTLFAAWHYQRRVNLVCKPLLMGSLLGLLGSFAGAQLLTLTSPDRLRQALPLMLVLLLAYTLWNQQLGQTHAPRFSGRSEIWAMGGVGGVMGLYDGFFGPGTGSLLGFLLVRFLGFDF